MPIHEHPRLRFAPSPIDYLHVATAPFVANTGGDITAHLDGVSEEGDPAQMIAALNTVARTRDMSRLARDADLTREGLHKALSPDGNLSFARVSTIAEALGLRVERHAQPVEAARSAREN